ncbi:hypothetical protein JTE90_027933 [Oedothorax gibbosus]|uniref:Uncharacterized protein n=1 Tax=Oedothorax gibbosus TaxID=931172 RepID=A0AAV6VGX3_9ARAC|nr:hypothetical protein JTE90_027933 [Oedothorax gibbosus]
MSMKSVEELEPKLGSLQYFLKVVSINAKMFPKLSAFGIFICGILATNMVNAVNIFKPPDESDVSEAETTPVPWLKTEYIPAIDDFNRNVLFGVLVSTQIQKIWNASTDSTTTRATYFKVCNAFFSEHKHAVPAALANIVSKAASLFDNLDKLTYFTTTAVSLAEFLLSHGVELDKETASKYVDSVSSALGAADTSTPEGELKALLTGWENYITSSGIKFDDHLDELVLLFTSQLIIYSGEK